MRRFICALMVFALLLPMATPVFATESSVEDAASYVEAGTGDIIRLETVDISSFAASRKNLSSDVFSTRIFRNNILEELLYVDVKNNLLRHEYPDGSVKIEALSNVVTLSAVPAIEETPVNVFESNSSNVSSRTDYILYEPFDIEQDTGVQVSLPGQPTYSGYQAMGYRGDISTHQRHMVICREKIPVLILRMNLSFSPSHREHQSQRLHLSYIQF